MKRIIHIEKPFHPSGSPAFSVIKLKDGINHQYTYKFDGINLADKEV